MRCCHTKADGGEQKWRSEHEIRDEKRIEILGTAIDNVSLDAAVARIVRLIDVQRFSFTVTPNVDHLMKLRNDAFFCEVYRQANLVVPDGVPLLWAARILGTPLSGRVNGTDLLERLSVVAPDHGYSIYLLGGPERSAEVAAANLKTRIPSLRVAGHSCPPVGFHLSPAMNAKVIADISVVDPTILFVALGAPKQEKWIARYGESTGVKHAIGVGASFSFVSGELRRAPLWMQKSGLEWLWRLAQEPGRLGRRYLVEDMPFLWLVLAEAWRRRFDRG